jgi:hypothetical protein
MANDKRPWRLPFGKTVRGLDSWRDADFWITYWSFAVVLKLVSLNPATQIAYHSSESSDQRLSAVSVL